MKTIKDFDVKGEVKQSDFSPEELSQIDIFLKDEGDFVTIGFQTEKAKKIMYNDNVLSKLSYTIVQGSIPKVDFPVDGIKYVKKFLDENGLTYEEC
jgi:hypothetical protein